MQSSVSVVPFRFQVQFLNFCTTQVKKARSLETNNTNVNNLNHGLGKESLLTVQQRTCLVMLTRIETISFKLSKQELLFSQVSVLGHSSFKLKFFKYTLNSVKCTSQVKKATSLKIINTNANNLNYGIGKESLWTVSDSKCLVMLIRTETISFKL